MDMGVYGERLRARARALGLTDAEVARRLGLAQGRYANYVNGNREPDLATFARICRALATTPDEILGFGSHGEGSAEAEPERRRALAAVEAMDGRAQDCRRHARVHCSQAGRVLAQGKLMMEV